ncbi:MAG: AAA family ATPase [Oscillospiraceae bacterium]|nr:AAA family ATPase [Oscillospiraceae bacterium]
MAILVMVYGQSGTGKSTSLRNFSPEDVSIINVSGKPLPFRKKLPTWSTDNYQKIAQTLPTIQTPSIVIDDATYLMTNEFMRNARVTGFQKFTDMALNFNSLIEITRTLPDDKIVYFIGHSDQADDGREHFKTIGKMLDNYVTVEGKFTIVLKTVVKDGEYYFSTQNNGQDTVKSPMGMFQSDLIDNDLKMVDSTIREYYGIEEETNNE